MGDNPRVDLIAELGSGPREVGRARRVMVRALHRWGIDGQHADTVLLLTSELVTNAIRHGSAPVQVRAGVSRRALRVEVHDRTPGEVTPRHAGPEDIDGRGLQLVASLADRWGTRGSGRGKRVWFELDT